VKKNEVYSETVNSGGKRSYSETVDSGKARSDFGTVYCETVNSKINHETVEENEVILKL